MRLMPFIRTSIDTQELIGVPPHAINSTDLCLRRIPTTPTRLSGRGGAEKNRPAIMRYCVTLTRTRVRKREAAAEHMGTSYRQTYPRPLDW